MSDDTRVNNLGVLESENSEGQIEPKQVQRKKMTALEATSTYEAPTGGKKSTDDKTGLLQESTIGYGAHERESRHSVASSYRDGQWDFPRFNGAHILATDKMSRFVICCHCLAPSYDVSSRWWRSGTIRIPASRETVKRLTTKII